MFGRVWFAAVVVAALSAGARAESAALSWRCVQEFDEHFHMLCIPHRGEADAGSHSGAAEAPAATSRAGLDMRPVAQRGDAEVFSADAWRVPLHSKPSDRALVNELLQSVLCGTRPACSVRYEASALRTARR